MEWKAIHFFIHDINYHAQFLTDYLKPEIERMKAEGYLHKFFYIIYWQGGNHVRFRYITGREQEVRERLSECFERFLKTYRPEQLLDEAAYLRLYSQNMEQVKDLYWVNDGEMLEMAYEPEYERYGGIQAIQYSENMFQCSSEYTLDILEAAKDRSGVKLYAALDMMRTALEEIEDKKDFLEQYILFWRGFNNEKKEHEGFIKGLYEKYKNRYQRTGEEKLEFYITWKEQLRENLAGAVRTQNTFQDGGQAKRLIMASLLHMNHNRLGIYPAWESILAKVLLLCMKEEAA